MRIKTAVQRLVFIALAVGLLNGCGHGPKNLSSAEFEAMKRADAAFRTLSDHSLDSVFVYGPLLAEAEKVVSELDSMTATDRGDARDAYYVAKTCVNAITESRRTYQEFHDSEIQKDSARIVAHSISEVESYIRAPSEITTP
jgi:hypothetical protein